MKTLTATKHYSGHDPATGRDIRVEPGGTIKVSDDKAEQLERDYPKAFEEFEGEPAGRAPASTPEPASVPTDPEELEDDELAELLVEVLEEIEDRDLEDKVRPELPEWVREGDEVEEGEDLSELSRDQLNAKATELGIEKPDKIKGGMPKVIEAIEAKQKELAEAGD